MYKNMNKRTVRKSVTLGQAFATPMPMPFRDDGLPDWDAPTLGSYVSFALENGPLKGRVVVLHRQPNGMYVIAEDDAHTNNRANRNKDKEKLRKEDDVVLQTSGNSEATDDDLKQIQELAESTQVAKSAAWTRKEGKNPRGGLNAAGRASARREGSNLKPPVKSNSGRSLADLKRRYSFLSRMSGNPGPEHDENGKPTRLLLSLQVWGASSKADARKKAAMLKRRIERMEGKGMNKTIGGRELTPEQIAARNKILLDKIAKEDAGRDKASRARWKAAAQRSNQPGISAGAGAGDEEDMNMSWSPRASGQLVFPVQKSAQQYRERVVKSRLEKSRDRAYEAIQELLRAERQSKMTAPLSKAEIERRALAKLGLPVVAKAKSMAPETPIADENPVRRNMQRESLRPDPRREDLRNDRDDRRNEADEKLASFERSYKKFMKRTKKMAGMDYASE